MKAGEENFRSFTASDSWSKILTAFFSVAIIFSVAAAFHRFVILRDYPVQVQAPCDPYTEKCFIYECDPMTEECSGDPTIDTSYYKLIDRNARNIPLCNPTDEGCDAFLCLENEEGCAITLCDSNTAEAEGAVCSDPVAYTLQNSLDEENVVEPVVDLEIVDGTGLESGDTIE